MLPRGRSGDSGVRDALHQAAMEEKVDFPGLGPHSFRCCGRAMGW